METVLHDKNLCLENVASQPRACANLISLQFWQISHRWLVCTHGLILHMLHFTYMKYEKHFYTKTPIFLAIEVMECNLVLAKGSVINFLFFFRIFTLLISICKSLFPHERGMNMRKLDC